MITIKEESGKVYMSPAGQPTFELIPFKKDEFKFKGLNGYSIKFNFDNQMAEEIVLHQPNGVFSGKRVK